MVKAENICFKKELDNLKSIKNKAKITTTIRLGFTVLFIHLGIFYADGNNVNAKNNIIMVFIAYFIIEFIFYPLGKLLKLIEVNISYNNTNRN